MIQSCALQLELVLMSNTIDALCDIKPGDHFQPIKKPYLHNFFSLHVQETVKRIPRTGVNFQPFQNLSRSPC